MLNKDESCKTHVSYIENQVSIVFGRNTFKCRFLKEFNEKYMNETFMKIHSLVNNFENSDVKKIKKILEIYKPFKVENIKKRVFIINVKNNE